jgi:hypothetical protein
MREAKNEPSTWTLSEPLRSVELVRSTGVQKPPLETQPLEEFVDLDGAANHQMVGSVALHTVHE